MGHLSLRLLGGFEVLLDGRRLMAFGYDKVRALLAYLSVEWTQAHSRQGLAGLLWPDQDEDHARQSLRQALNSLRAILGDRDNAKPFLLVSRDAIRFSTDSAHDSDVEAFDGWEDCGFSSHTVKSWAVCRARHLEAASLYRGPFLANFSLPDAPEFESWLQLKRERLDRQAAELFQRLAACHEQSGEYEKALRYAHAQLRVNAWNEEAHRQVMRLLAINGERNAAIAHYQRCREVLAVDVGVEPDLRTRALFEEIRAGRLGRTIGLPVERLLRAEPSEADPCGGAPPGHAGERRLLTVLSCELRGTLSEDPEDLHERLTGYHQTGAALVQRYGGYVVERESGLLTAYFGYPQPCEDAARQAVRAACALRQNLLAPLAVRIRVHSGVVLVPPASCGTCGVQAAVVGAVPKLARAMHGLASATDLVISAATRRLAGDVVQCRSRGSHALTDYPEPFELYQVLFRLGAIQRLEQLAAAPSSPLIGREVELAMTAAYWREAHAGAGNALLVTGERGIGKSAAAAALWQHVRGEGRRLLIACGPHMIDRPFQALPALLQQLFECAPAADRETCLRHLEAGLKRWRLLEAFEALVPLIAPTAGSHGGLVDGKAAAGVRRHLLELIARVSRKQPLFLVVDDVHWADAETLQLLAELIEKLPALRMLAVCNARQGWEPPWPPARMLHRLTLGPLDARQSTALVRRHFPGGSDAAVAALAARCDGVPLSAIVLARSARAGGEQGGAAYDDGPVPMELMGAMGEALDQLGPAKPLVQLACTLGREFSERLLLQVLAGVRNLGLPVSGLADALKHLVGLGILESWDDGTGARFRFKRALLRDVAYASQPRSQLRLYQELRAQAESGTQRTALSAACPNAAGGQPA